MLPLSAFTMYLGYARTHSDELAVLKPTTAEKRDLYAKLAKARRLDERGRHARFAILCFGFVHSEELGVAHLGAVGYLVWGMV